MFLMDTNVISELRRQRPHGGVLAWLDSTPRHIVFLPAVVIGEIQSGIEITREQDTYRARELESWLETLILAYRVLPMDFQIFRAWARLMHRKSNTLNADAMIAATAIVHGFTVVTRNVKDFEQFGVALLNLFEG